jgi:hypothetical protein
VAAKARKRLNRRVIAFILHTTEPQQANKVKNYGQTIQQSRKSETPEQLPQTQKSGGQGQESRCKKNGLTGVLRSLKRPLIRAAFSFWRGSRSLNVAVLLNVATSIL